MSKTGTSIVTSALREIQVLDPTATASGEHLADGLDAAEDLLDTWRLEHLTLGGVLISTYSLVASDGAYTIGSSGDFNQAYPTKILRWSVIPDDDAADPLELPMGRPLNSDQWQQVRQKTATGAYPTKMFFDDAWSSGLGNCHFHPIPDNGDVDVRLHTLVPAITALVAGTTYDLRPGFMRAFTLALALEVADRYGKAATVTPRLERRAANAMAVLERHNIRPKQSPIRPEFVIGGRARRTFNIYTGGT